MDANEEQTFEGVAYDITRSELPTWSSLGKFGGTFATQTFRLRKRGRELA